MNEIQHDHLIIQITINSYIKKLLERKEKGIVDESDPIMIGKDATFIYRTVKDQGHRNCALTPCEEEIFSQVAECLGNMAFNLDRNHMQSMIDTHLINSGLMHDEFTGISESTLS